MSTVGGDEAQAKKGHTEKRSSEKWLGVGWAQSPKNTAIGSRDEVFKDFRVSLLH